MSDPTQPNQPGWPESTWPPPAPPGPPVAPTPPTQPAYPGGVAGQPAGYPVQPGVADYGRRTNTLAIVALILAVVGLAPVGAILGHVARRQIRETGEDGDGLALAGIIVGWVITGIWVCVGGFVVLALIGAAAANA